MATVFGSLGADALVGTELADTVTGGPPGNDAADVGNDTLSGLGGADLIFGWGGNDSLDGGDGNDSIDGGSGVDTLVGGAGNDSLFAGPAPGDFFGGDVLQGGDGDDTLSSIVHATTIDGGAGQDLIIASDAGGLSSSINAGSGDDTIVSLKGFFGITGGDGIDVVDYSGNASITLFLDGLLVSVLKPSSEDSLISGIEHIIAPTGAANSIGMDTFGNRLEVDLSAHQLTVFLGATPRSFIIDNFRDVRGASFADRLVGDAAGNKLDGGGGNDTLIGGDGADVLSGGAGDDTFVIDDQDTISDTAGIDTVQTTASHTLATGFENLTLLGKAALDGTGNQANNVLVGNGGANRLSGLDGADVIDGGKGDDTLIGGLGTDVLTGSKGNDSFRFQSAADGGDIITDYNGTSDSLEISASGFGAGLFSGMNVVAAGRYVANASGQATAPAGIGQFVFETDTNLLWWDADGQGAAAGVVIAYLAGAKNWSGAEVIIVA